MKKRRITIIVVSIIVFLFFNFLGSMVISASGQTGLEIFLSYLAYAAWGLIFGIILIFVDSFLTKKGK
jgi:hypothetical protein